MHPETPLNKPRPPFAKPRRRAPGTVPGRRFAHCHFRRRASHRPPADYAPSWALPAASETGRRARAEREPARGAPIPDVAAHQEILRGAAIGIFACLVFVWLAGASSLSFIAAVIWGSSFGALIGMLLWIGSGDVPEDPIPPPDRRQARDEKSDKPHPRR